MTIRSWRSLTVGALIALLLTLAIGSVLWWFGRPAPAAVRVIPLAQQPILLAADPLLGRAYLAVGDSQGFGTRGVNAHVLVIDDRAAVIARQIKTVDQPQDMVLNGRAHRLLIANDLGGVSVLDTLGMRGLAASGSLYGSAIGLIFGLSVDARTGLAFRTNQLGNVAVLDAATGRLLRALISRGANWVSPENPTVDDATDRIFVCTVASRGVAQLRLLDAATGHPVATVAVGRSGPFAAYCPSAAIDARGARVLVLDAAGGRLLTLDGRTGAVRSVLKVPSNAGNWPSSLVVSSALRRAFVVDHALARVEMVDTRSNRLVASVPVPAQPWQVFPDASRRRAMVLAVNPATSAARGWVTVVSTDTGQSLRTFGVGAGIGTAAFDERSGKLFVARDDGALEVVDDSRPALLRPLSLGFPASLLAVDGSAGRVIAAGSDWQASPSRETGLLRWLTDHLPGLWHTSSSVPAGASSPPPTIGDLAVVDIARAD